jgi:hypothetical protein
MYPKKLLDTNAGNLKIKKTQKVKRRGSYCIAVDVSR